MPALEFLKRKWLIACDDFVFPFSVEACLRASWFVVILVIISVKLKNCDESGNLYMFINYFLYAVALELLITTLLTSAIVFKSAQGSVLEAEKRKPIKILLYAKLFTILIDVALSSFGVWLYTNLNRSCPIKEIFIKITTICGWLYVLIIVFAVLVCYDSLGAKKYWKSEINLDSLNFFRKAQYIWKLRLKLFCCCADISEDNDFIYVEISSFLASFLTGIDLVPTDILAGIISLSHKHALDRRKYLLNLHPKSNASILLENRPVPVWMNPKNAHYFLRVAKSTYGWMAFFSPLRPWNICALSSHVKCCSASSDRIHDDCCYANTAAIQKISGFADTDIVHASFQNNIHEPAFYVAIDHSRSYVIIAIRGTSSFSDLLTDIDAENLYFPENENNPRYRCHRGTLKSAIFLRNKLEELGVLKMVLAEHPLYTLAITGHSLGGSIAAVLALLLKPLYPNVECYAYAPLACLSALGVEDTLDTVFSIVIGDDITPRLCASNCKQLRKELMESLKYCQIPKYKILASACWYHMKRYCKIQVPNSACSGYENAQFEQGNDNLHEDQELPYMETSLYAPGRILYFDRKTSDKPFWLTGFNFTKIVINPAMIADHQPRKIQTMLDLYVKEESDSCDKINEINN